jgi:hypothetical protein
LHHASQETTLMPQDFLIWTTCVFAARSSDSDRLVVSIWSIGVKE